MRDDKPKYIETVVFKNFDPQAYQDEAMLKAKKA